MKMTLLNLMRIHSLRSIVLQLSLHLCKMWGNQKRMEVDFLNCVMRSQSQVHSPQVVPPPAQNVRQQPRPQGAWQKKVTFEDGAFLQPYEDERNGMGSISSFTWGPWLMLAIFVVHYIGWQNILHQAPRSIQNLGGAAFRAKLCPPI